MLGICVESQRENTVQLSSEGRHSVVDIVLKGNSRLVFNYVSYRKLRQTIVKVVSLIAYIPY